MGNNLPLKTTIKTDLGKGGRRTEDEKENKMRGHVM
jgi:hypothetical protein